MEPSLRLTARRKTLSGIRSPGLRRLPSPSRENPSSAEVTKIVSSHTIGVAALQLGIFARHRTFCVSVQVVGRSRAVSVLPFELGPRHWGQCAGSGTARTRPAYTKKMKTPTLFRRLFIHPPRYTEDRSQGRPRLQNISCFPSVRGVPSLPDP